MSGSTCLGIKGAIASLIAAGALCTGSFAQHENCPNPKGGNCFEATPGIPGCQDEDCCNEVCKIDVGCCDNEWDEICALFAQDVNCRTILHVPDDFSAFRGFHWSGDLNSLLASDDDKLCYNPGITVNPTEAPITLDFFGILPNDSPASLDVTIESSANTIGLELTISFWNFNTNSWDVVGTAAQSLNTDTVRTFAGTPADHVEPGTGEVRTRYEVRVVSFIFVFPWLDCVDRVFWTTSN